MPMSNHIYCGYHRFVQCWPLAEIQVHSKIFFLSSYNFGNMLLRSMIFTIMLIGATAYASDPVPQHTEQAVELADRCRMRSKERAKCNAEGCAQAGGVCNPYMSRNPKTERLDLKCRERRFKNRSACKGCRCTKY